MNIKDFELISSNSSLGEKNGRSYGYISLDECQIFLDYWKDHKKFYTQWKVIEQGKKQRYIGSANVTDEAINVQKNTRKKHLKETITSQFPDIVPETVDLFFNELIEVANMTENKLFPEDNQSKQEDVVQGIQGFNDYDDEVKEAALTIFKEYPLEYILWLLNKVHCGDEDNIEMLVLVLFTKHVENSKPVSVIIVGTTESGKTSLANKTAKITPDRFLIETSSMSSKAAFYHQDKFNKDYNHLIMNDFLDSPEAIGTLKALTDTELETVKHMTVSDEKEAVTLEVPGKNTVIITAARQLTDKELNRRLLHLNPDESEEHLNITKDFIKKGEAGLLETYEFEFKVGKAVYDKLIEKKYEVAVPWILLLDYNLFGKTDIKHFTSLIKARTLMNQTKRTEIVDNVLLSTLEDFHVVTRLWSHIIQMQTTYLPSKAFEILPLLPKWDVEEYNESITSENRHYGKKIKEIAQELKVSQNTIKKWIWGQEDQRGLLDLGYINAQKSGDTNTSPWILYRIHDKPFQDANVDIGTSQFANSQIFKGFITLDEKRNAIRSICNWYKRKEYLEENNLEELVESILKESKNNIETDQDIIDISEFIKKIL